MTHTTSLAIFVLMYNLNFNPNFIAREMTKNWKGYYAHSFISKYKSLYKIIDTFTQSRIKACIASVIYSIATTLFAKSKRPGVPHKHRKRRTFVLLASLTAYILLPFSFKKSKHIGNLIYSWYWQDRIAHGYMTPLRDVAQMKLMSEIFNLDQKLFRSHCIAVSEASVILDAYEYHEVADAPWDKVEDKLRESFVELKR